MGPDQRAPGTVVAAAVLVGLVGVLAGVAIGGALSGPVVGFVVGLATLALAILVVVGLWRGNRGAHAVAVVLGLLSVVSGVSAWGDGDLGGVVQVLLGGLVAGLLLIPVSAREWFSRR